MSDSAENGNVSGTEPAPPPPVNRTSVRRQAVVVPARVLSHPMRIQDIDCTGMQVPGTVRDVHTILDAVAWSRANLPAIYSLVGPQGETFSLQLRDLDTHHFTVKRHGQTVRLCDAVKDEECLRDEYGNERRFDRRRTVNMGSLKDGIQQIKFIHKGYGDCYLLFHRAHDHYTKVVVVKDDGVPHYRMKTAMPLGKNDYDTLLNNKKARVRIPG